MLEDVAEKLENALDAAQYRRRWSYLSVPKGFALVTRLEQIKADGTPSPEPARWSSEMPSVYNLTLLEFIRALANAQPGYYRVIAFIVSDQGWSRRGKEPTGKDVALWLEIGETRLPPEIGNLTYGPRYKTTALVYQFKKVSQDAAAAFLDPGPISADDHIKKAGIYDPLSRR